MRIQSLSTSAYPLYATDILVQLKALWSREEYSDTVKEKIRQLYRFEDCFFFSSGRAALYALLAVLTRKYANKDEVVVPGYTCYSVPSAIIKAKLKVVPCEMDETTLDFDYRELENVLSQKTLAVIATSLFGLRINTRRAADLAKKYQAFILEDAAQAFGSPEIGRFADATLLSFARGKNVTSINGGALFTMKREYAQDIGPRLPEATLAKKLRLIWKTIIMEIFIHPHLYWWIKWLPFTGIGKSQYSTDFPVEKLSNVQQALLVKALERFSEVSQIRLKNAGYYYHKLNGLSQIYIPKSLDLQWAPLRFPILVAHQQREKIYRLLKNYGVSKVYPQTVCNIKGLPKKYLLEKCTLENAQQLVDQLLTLPVHPLVKREDREYIVETIRGRLV